MRKETLAAAVCVFVAGFAAADSDPEGETLGEFCYNARTGAVVTVDVAAGAVRRLAAMPYGRGSGAAIVKTGPGKLIVGDLRNYPGVFRVADGAVRLGDADEPAAEREIPDIQNLALDDGVEVEVADGKTARVRLADFSSSFTKSGGGILEVVNTDDRKLPGVKLSAGRIVFVNEPTVASSAQPAAGASLHLDANDAESFVFTGNSSTSVSRWYDANGVNYAETKNGTPVLVAGATTNKTTGAVLNAVSFGSFRSGSRASFATALHGVRTVFVVAARGGTRNTGMLLGTAPEWCVNEEEQSDLKNDIADFRYKIDSNGFPLSPFTDDTCSHSVRHYCGTVHYYYDGAAGDTPAAETTRPVDVPAPEEGSVHQFMLYEVRLPAGAHVSALCGLGSSSLFTGGWRYGEVLLYERDLSARERIATRNYLAKKWLGRTDDELTTLPEAAADPTPFEVPEYAVTDGAVLHAPDGETLRVACLSGAGEVVKTGVGTLTLKDAVGFTGTVSVASGTLRLTGVLPPVEPAPPAAEKCVLHLDAGDPETLTLVDHSDGSERVGEWRSKTSNGWRVTPTADAVGNYPILAVDPELGDLKAVRIPTSYGMWFKDAAGAEAITTNILSVLWVVGSQDGGGFLLGLSQSVVHNQSGTAKASHFHRGEAGYGRNATDPVFYSGAADGARTMEMYLNDLRLSADKSWPLGAADQTPMNTGLSGGWDYLSGRVSAIHKYRLAADSLAYHPTVPERRGRQRLAELMIFERQLSAAEERAAGAYLRIKWNLEPTWQRSRTNGLGVAVADGATLDLGGTNAYLRALGGAGSVVGGDVEAAGLSASADGPLTVSGRFTAADGFTIDLGGLPLKLEGTITLLRAEGGIANAAAIENAAILCGHHPEARVSVRGDAVDVYLPPRGFAITVY